MKCLPVVLLIAVVLSSCASLTSLPESELAPGYYTFQHAPLLPIQGSRSVKTYVDVKGDTLQIFPIDKSIGMIKNSDDHIFRKQGVDVDVLVVPFKYRPAQATLPSQLTTDFNGNLFLGYRIDRYVTDHYDTPAGLKRRLRHKAISIGCFGGIGTTFISPWTTGNQTTDEYNGFIFSRGFAAMVGIRSLTLGVGVGWDYLADRDKDIWIYQNKPWYGLTVSLNLN